MIVDKSARKSQNLDRELKLRGVWVRVRFCSFWLKLFLMILVDTFDHIFLFSKIAITLFEDEGLFEDISEAFSMFEATI